jgi:hypothetical protein
VTEFVVLVEGQQMGPTYTDEAAALENFVSWKPGCAVLMSREVTEWAEVA